MYYYTNEIAFRGHPDKVADQLADALVDAYLREDPNSRCAIEVVGGKDTIFVTGEVTSKANISISNCVKFILADIGYDSDKYTVIDNIGKQSKTLNSTAAKGNAGDQGMMFGYACRDTIEKIPTAQAILQNLAAKYDNLRKSDSRFLPDGKAQITGEYSDDGKLIRIKDFTISYQNTETERKATDKILKDLALGIADKYGVRDISTFHINAAGKFNIGGFEADAGLTGRKIVSDSYESFAKVGGGAFSGKDPSKVDRSGAYKARQIAIETLSKHPEIRWCEVQIAYTIGIAQPTNITIRSDKGLIDVPDKLYIDCKPENIIERLNLLNQTFRLTAQFGHFGHDEFTWEH